MRCFIIDDDKTSVDIITDHIRRTPFLTLAGTSTSPVQAKNILYNKKDKIDILFMGIEMKIANGIKLATELKKHTDIIFTTSHRHYGPEAFELHAIDYLLKPIFYERFQQAIAKYLQQSKIQYIFVKTSKKGKHIRIDCNEILYVESQLNYLKFHFDNAAPISTAMTVNELEVKLRIHPFITRIHRSYLVNKSKISHIEDKKVFLLNNCELPISNTYYKNLISII